MKVPLKDVWLVVVIWLIELSLFSSWPADATTAQDIRLGSALLVFASLLTVFAWVDSKCGKFSKAEVVLKALNERVDAAIERLAPMVGLLQKKDEDLTAAYRAINYLCDPRQHSHLVNPGTSLVSPILAWKAERLNHLTALNAAKNVEGQ